MWVGRKLREKPILVVIGPNEILFIVDHHHYTSALLIAGVTHSYVRVLDDLSNLSDEKFWQNLKKRHWAYFGDGHGGEIPLEDLKKIKNVYGLKDDPYRSLAAFVRDEGGFKKVEEPFVEFKWADFFRTRVKIGKGRRAFNRAVREALKISHSSEAKHLPGWRRPS